MTGVNRQSNTKADRVCTNKCPNRKTHDKIIQNNAILKTIKPAEIKQSNLFDVHTV